MESNLKLNKYKIDIPSVGIKITRYKNKIETKECKITDRFMQVYILESILSTHELMFCGPVPFQTMKMYHEGKWIIEL